MSSRHVVLSKPRGINPSPFFLAIASVTPLIATLARRPLRISKRTTLALLFAALTRTSPVSPLLATLTKNIRGGGTLHTLLFSPLPILLTLFLSSTYTHFSFSYEEPCI